MIFAHTDLDGFVSAMAIYLYTKDGDIYPIGYANNRIDVIKKAIKTSQKKKPIYLLDLSFTKQEIQSLQQEIENNEFYYFDHHKSSVDIIDYFENLAFDVSDKVCSATLCYNYLIENSGEHSICEKWTEYAYKRDRFLFNDEIEYCKSLNLDFIVRYLARIGRFSTGVKALAQVTPELALQIYSEQIKYYQLKLQDAIKIALITGKTYNLDGIKLFIGYTTEFVSDVLYAVYKEQPYDIGVLIHFNKDIVVSFRTNRDDIDVSKIAENMQGGGHPKASGGRLNIEDLSKGYDGIANKIETILKGQKC